jgi:hypothetical protein
MCETVHSFKEKFAETRDIVKRNHDQSLAENIAVHSTIKELRESVQNSERKRHEMSKTICPLSPLQEINEKLQTREREASERDATDQRLNAQIIEVKQKLITSQTIFDQPVKANSRMLQFEQQFQHLETNRLSQLAEIHRLKDEIRAKELEQIRIATETDTEIQEREERYTFLNHENTTMKEKIQKIRNLLDEFNRL